MSTEEYIEIFRESDTRQLALQGRKFPEVDLPFALNQIAGWQKARTKLPTWAKCSGIIYPPHLSMEQCSSEQTAIRKFSSVLSLFKDFHAEAVDLTGGFGVDFSFMAPSFAKATYVEQQENLCNIAQHNFRLMGLNHVDVVCGNGEEFLKSMKPVDFIYLDPARRDSNGERTYALEDCTPNVLELKELLLEKAPIVMVKLSPMLDWHKVVNDLGCVSEVRIISVRNECKEIVIMMKRDNRESLHIVAINDDETVDFCIFDDSESCQELWNGEPANVVGHYLYEPNASLMKAGCFGLLCQRYGVKKIGRHSNLFVSTKRIDFPGRTFQISAVSSMNKKELKYVLNNISKANISVRNFPLSADALRKQLKLKDGGNTYIFGTTIAEKQHLLLITYKP